MAQALHCFTLMQWTFETILDAGLAELTEICDSATFDALAICLDIFYARTVVSFLRAEMTELKAAVSFAEALRGDETDLVYLRAACRMRLVIRERAFDPSLLAHAQTLSETPSRWQAELSNLVATLLFNYEDFPKAQARYLRAALAFDAQGCFRKALRSRMNVLVCESHIYPEKNLIPGYHDLYRRSLAKNRRDLIVATTCLLNISREYQRAGANLVALKYCDKSLPLFEFHFGSSIHHLTLVHRAHLLAELGRVTEARIDLETVAMSTFPEVVAAIALVRSLLDGTRIDDSQDLLPTWRERVNVEPGTKLSPLEEKLLALLARGPRDRLDLAGELYGEALDLETRLNRFKSLLTTLRKKQPTLVVCTAGQYRLADKILAPRLARKV